MEREFGKEALATQINMKENTNRIRKMAMEFSFGAMAISIKETLLTISGMGMEKCSLPTATYSKASGTKE